MDALRKRPHAWVDFMMRFELGLEKPNPRRAVRSAGTIAGAYSSQGAFSPLGPYVVLSGRPADALLTVPGRRRSYRPGWSSATSRKGASPARHRSVAQ